MHDYGFFSSLLQALKEFLKVLFLDHTKYRDLVLQSLSLVDASLPELHLMSVDLLTVFLRNIGSRPPEGECGMSASTMSPVGAAHVQFTVEGAMHHPTLSKKVCSHMFYCGWCHASSYSQQKGMLTCVLLWMVPRIILLSAKRYAYVCFTVDSATHHSTVSKKVCSCTFYCG